MLLIMKMFLSAQLFDGFDDEYQCPILDEDRVCTIVMKEKDFYVFLWSI